MELALHLLGLAVGISVLAWSADLFVDGSAKLARRCGLSSLLVGMIVIGFGTSFPELMVSLLAALKGNPSIALGNAYGSNIANICLILGLTAVLSPIAVGAGVLKRELPILIFATLICGGLLLNGVISRGDAAIMLVLFVGFLVNNIWAEKRREKAQAGEADKIEEGGESETLGKSVGKVVLGLALLIGSSRLLVVCAVWIARKLGVSDLLVGLTIVAVGTSLPELASSIAAVRKKEHDLALGNIVGSNFFNLLAVVGLAGVVTPMTVAEDAKAVNMILTRDYPVNMVVTILLMIFCIPWRRGGKAVITRIEGFLLLVIYVAYMVVLVRHELITE